MRPLNRKVVIHVFPSWITFALVALLTFVVNGAARAARESGTVVKSASLPLANTNWQRTFQIPQFDASLGHLDHVQISLSGSAEATIKIENQGSRSSNYSFKLTPKFTLKSPTDGQLLTLDATTISVSGTMPAYDGTLDYAGTSGATFERTAQGSAVTNLTAESDLVAFVGTGSVSLPVEGSLPNLSSPGGSSSSSVRASTAANITVTYHYSQVAPSGLSVNVRTSNSINLTWAPVPGAEQYKIERSLDGLAGWSEASLPATSSPNFTASSLAQNTAYYFRVKAIGPAGESTYSPVLSTRTKLASPANFKATNADQKLTLSWDSVPGATSYLIRRKTSFSGPETEIYAGTDQSFIDQGLVNGNSYYYSVLSVNEYGESDASGLIGIPSRNTGVSLNFESGGAVSGRPLKGEISLREPVSGAVNFSVVVVSGPILIPATLSIPAGETVVQFQAPVGLVTDDAVCEIRLSWDTVGPQPAGSLVNTVLLRPLLTGIVSSVRQAGQTTLDLVANEAADRYEVESKVGSGAWQVLGQSAMPTFTDPVVRLEQASYRVRALNGAGYGPYSAEFSVSYDVSPPMSPSNLTAVSIGRQVQLRWKGRTGLMEYRVRRSQGSNVQSFTTTDLEFLDSSPPGNVPLVYTVSAFDSATGLLSTGSASVSVTVSIAGRNPEGSVVISPDQRLYGVTSMGGVNGTGTVFELFNGQSATLSFDPLQSGGTNPSGAEPYVVNYLNGNLFVGTRAGGLGQGTLVRIDPNGAVAIAPPIPYEELTVGPDGLLYGLTLGGGENGTGAFFCIDASGNPQLRYSFPAEDFADGPASPGYSPVGGLAWDASTQSFLGTTRSGGMNGAGAVFRITISGLVQTLASFLGEENAVISPAGRLTRASDGNFYGVSDWGGDYGQGTIYRVTPSGIASVVFSFGGNLTVLSQPNGTLVLGPDGALYGTSREAGSEYGGAIYRLSGGQVSIVYGFNGLSDGYEPRSGLTVGSDGAFYGAALGGTGFGVIYRYSIADGFSILYNFKDGF